VLGIF